MKYCPICESLLTADTEVYTKIRKSVHEGVEIIGCDNCVNTHWADEFLDEEELNDLEESRYYNSIADEHQLRRVGFNFD